MSENFRTLYCQKKGLKFWALKQTVIIIIICTLLLLHSCNIVLLKASNTIMAEETSKTESMDTGSGIEPSEVYESSVDTVTAVTEDRKRKGPKLRRYPLKRQNSLPNIRQLGKVKKAMSFSDMLLVTFRDNSFVRELFPF